MALNPFPGLRPFDEGQSDLFFGRDEQIEELLDRLQQHRFLAVVGTSGSGKSSVVRAGLIPTLKRGYLAEAGTRWRIAIFRPGSGPKVELARALIEAFGLSEREEVLSILSRSNSGLSEFARRNLKEGESLLVVVDQFEELFRYQQGAADRNHTEESAAFVKLLLAATGHSELLLPVKDNLPVYVVLTMRSDFLGKCARFRGLPEALNDSQYLIPRMTREQQRQAIECPIGMAGARINPQLVQRLLNDVGDDPDQLPVLQHALMRTWEQSADARAKGLAIDFSDYGSSGEMKDALNKDADSVFEALGDEHDRRLVRRIFQRLVEPSAKDEETRRPTPLSELIAVTGADEKKVRELIEIFRAQGFLTVSQDPDPIIDVTHESLIRLWRRLNGWVREEAESARIYSRLAESARKRTSLYRDPELTEALRWKATESPNAAWAERYPPWKSSAFPVAMEFLEKSEADKERQQAVKNRNRILLISGLVVALVLGGLATVFWRRAIKAGLVADEQRLLAVQQRGRAIALKLGAEAEALGRGPARLNQRSLLLAIEALRRYPSRENDYALRQAMARAPLLVARMKHDEAVISLQFSEDGKLLITGSNDKTARIWEAASGRELGRLEHQSQVYAVKMSRDGRYVVTASGGRDNDNTFGKKKSKEDSEGEPPSVLRGWELSGTSIGKMLFEYSSPNAIDDFAFDPSGTRLVSLIDDRVRATRLDEPDKTQEVTLEGEGRKILSEKGDYLATSTKGGLVQVLDCQSMRFVRSIRPRVIPLDAESSNVYPACVNGHILGIAARFVGKEGWDSELGFWDAISGRLLSLPFKYSEDRSILSSRGELAAIQQSESLILWDTASGKELWNAETDWPEEGMSWRRLRFSANDKRLAVNVGDLAVRIYDVSGRDEMFRVGLDKQARDIALSPDGQYLAVGDVDGEVLVWHLQRGSEHQLDSAPGYGSIPLYSHTGRYVRTENGSQLRVFDQKEGRQVLEEALPSDHRWAVNGIFSPDDRYFVSGAPDGKLRIFDLSDGHMLSTVAPGGTIVAITFSAPDNTLVVATREGVISKWNPTSGTPAGKFETGGPDKDAFSGPYRVYFSGDGALCAITASENEFHLWDVSKGTLLGKVAGKTFWGATFSPDGKLLALLDEVGMSVWQTAPLKLAWHDKTDRYTMDFDFSPDGKSLAATMGKGGIVVWESSTGQPKFSLKRDVEAEGIAFTPDGNHLAATYNDGFTFVWRLQDRVAVSQIPLRGPDELGSRKVAFTPDGKFLVVEDSPASGDGNIFRTTWWHPEDLINEACRRISRNLTPAEWEQYLLDEPYNKTCPNLP